MPNRHRRGPSGPHGPGVIAWCHVVDAGEPVIIASFGIDTVIKTALGEYEIRPFPTKVAINLSAVGGTFRNSVPGVAGLFIPGNIVGPPPVAGAIAFIRFQVFPGNNLESGDFDMWVIQ